MSTFFSKIKDSAGSIGDLQESILGPDYKYYKFIKTPTEMGMSGEGSLDVLGKDIKGLMSYTKLLVSGGGDASVTGKPLGNKFFMDTGATCTDTDSSNTVSRSIYIDNVPSGNIPFLTSGTGVQFTAFSGLIPGTLENITRINPIKIFTTFTSGPNPKCRAITMEVIDKDNNSSFETKYITEDDISDIPACSFSNKVNPVTEVRCREGFTTSGRTGSFGSNGGNRNTGRRTSGQLYSYSTPVPNKRMDVVPERIAPYDIEGVGVDNDFDNSIEDRINCIRPVVQSKCGFAKITPEKVLSNNSNSNSNSNIPLNSYAINPEDESIKDNEIISKSGFPDDTFVKIYFSALGLFGLYLLSKMIQKQGKNQPY
jgi:hypothetical protein